MDRYASQEGMGLNKLLQCLFVVIIVFVYAMYELNLVGGPKPFLHFRKVDSAKEDGIENNVRNWSVLGYWTDMSGDIVGDITAIKSKDIKHLFTDKYTMQSQRRPLVLHDLTTRQGDMKYIMLWKPEKDVKPPLDFQNCEYSACAMTGFLRQADVLWLDVNSLKFEALPPRLSNQIWLFGSRDPPDLPMFDYLDRPDLNNQVNWTWYLLRDSTWQARYGHLQERPLPKKQYNKIFHNKTHDVAWFVSQCERPSRRMEYVKRMKTQVDVHIYGLCGNFTCGKSGYHMGNKREECLNMLSRSYKFYLAFENSFCKDYVTEKFFNLFNEVETIPVVRGGFEYHKYFPEGIYIDAANFSSPESLGQYLRELARDEQRYTAMLKRKNRFIQGDKPIRISCEVCKAAHLQQPRHVYENLYRWLRAPGNCWRPTDL